jgi:GNAT superfamily N-acetyltransferase
MIRPYRDSDISALREICFQTALYGRDIEPLCGDREFIAEAILGYYTRFEKESLFVAEDGGRVVGYLTGCADTKRAERLFARAIAPRILWRFFRRGHWHRAGVWQIIAGVAMLGLRRHGAVRKITEEYPAHCHVDIAPGAQRTGLGSKLMEAFIDRLNSQGVKGIHVSTPTDPGKRFFAKMGFVLLSRHPGPTLGGVSPGEIWLMGRKLGNPAQRGSPRSA